MAVTAAAAKRMIRALPGVEEGASYGKPAFKLRGKYFTHLRDDETVLVLPMTLADREVWLDLAPETYFVTDHYRGWPCVLVRLAAIEPDELAARLEQAWRMKASKTMVKAFDAERGSGGGGGK